MNIYKFFRKKQTKKNLMRIDEESGKIQNAYLRPDGQDYDLIVDEKVIAKVWDIQKHSTCSINISDWKEQKFNGHLNGIQSEDFFCTKVESGNITLVKILDLDYMQDPKDQFFCNGKPIGFKKIK